MELAGSQYSRRLRWQRLRNGKDTVETARLLGTTRETISRIENGHQGRRANVFKVQRAAEVFGVPDYYFTASTPQEYMQRYIRENATALIAQWPEPHQRLEWVIRHLAEQFPPEDFSVDRLLSSLGMQKEDFDRYLIGEHVPSGGLLEDLFSATGASPVFIMSGRGGAAMDLTYENVLEMARRRGLTPSDVKWAIQTVFGKGDEDDAE